jgi:hypothetical protein
MSKKALKKYLNSLEKEQLEEQLLDLYERFKEVKVFYNFVFNPKEEKLVEEAKVKISKEYFPTTGKRKPKKRRSVAQKHIKHFIQLGLDAPLIADVMVYNIEIAQTFNAQRPIKQDTFYKSMLNSFEQAIDFVQLHGLYAEFQSRITGIKEQAKEQGWFNALAFENAISEAEGSAEHFY